MNPSEIEKFLLTDAFKKKLKKYISLQGWAGGIQIITSKPCNLYTAKNYPQFTQRLFITFTYHGD